MLMLGLIRECWPGKSLPEVVEIFYDLDFPAIEIALHEDGGTAKPSEMIAIQITLPPGCVSAMPRYRRVQCSTRFVTGEQHYQDFAAICRIAKATKVVTLVVPSAELGTPFNEEVEHLKRLVEIAASKACASAREDGDR